MKIRVLPAEYNMAKSYLSHLPESAINAVFSENEQAIKAEGAKLHHIDGRVFTDLKAPHQNLLIGHNPAYLHSSISNALARHDFQTQLPHNHHLVTKLKDSLISHLSSPDSWHIDFLSAQEMTIEHALGKIFDYWHKKNQNQRRIVLTFAHSAHGQNLCCKNFNASYQSHNPFQDFLIPTEHLPYPCTWQEDEQIEKKEYFALARLQEFLNEQSTECAALLVEPLLQTTAGMLACRPTFLNQVYQIIKNHNIPIIADERHLSPMRSGRFLTSDYIKESPDVILLGHSLTNNASPLGTVLLKKTFLTAQSRSNIYHLACIAATKTLETLTSGHYKEHIQNLQTVHAQRLNRLDKQPIIKNIRFLGTIGAFEVICEDLSQQEKLIQWFHQKCFDQQLMLQPHGRHIAIMPPLCLSTDELNQVYDIIEDTINTLPLKYITSDLID